MWATRSGWVNDATRSACLLALLAWAGASLPASAQSMGGVSGGGIRGVSSGRIGTAPGSSARVATAPGGEHAGAVSFSEGGARVAHGRVAGYGATLRAGSLNEYGSLPGHSFGGSFGGADFVATMPLPPPIGMAPSGSGVSGSGYGVHFSGAARGTRVSRGGGHSRPVRSSDAILNPFTHPIGPSVTLPGTTLSSGLGSSR